MLARAQCAWLGVYTLVCETLRGWSCWVVSTHVIVTAYFQVFLVVVDIKTAGL